MTQTPSETSFHPMNPPASPLPTGLYLVSTPIGNLGDITHRALEVLEQVDHIAAEDTRVARKLLNHFGIQQKTMSFFRDNEDLRVPRIVENLQKGARVALISDAGTPAISDPGYLLVRAAVAAGVPVFPIPGASAVLAGLVGSGLPCDRFLFLGFLPARSSRRKSSLEPFKRLPVTLVFYESPRRVVECLKDLQEVLGDREACVGRELTKRYEEFVRGRLSEIHADFAGRDAIKGEFVVMVEGTVEQGLQTELGDDGEVEVSGEDSNACLNRARELLVEGGSLSKLAKKLSSQFDGLTRKDAYQLLMQLREEEEDEGEEEE